MYLVDPSSNLIVVIRERRLQDPAQRRRSAPGTEHRAAPHRQIFAAARQVVGTILSWVADLPYDSRERLGSKEQELAVLGISWATDPLHDAVLAREIEVARQRRRSAGELASGAIAAPRPGPPPEAIRGRRDGRGPQWVAAQPR
jgi:hypothetical protein